MMTCIDSVFEIKGSPCTRCAHFGGRVHRVQDLCTLQVHVFFIFSIWFYRKEILDIMLGASFLRPSHPAGAPIKSLISNTHSVLIGCRLIENKHNVLYSVWVYREQT